MTIRNYADLIAWQNAMALAETVYKRPDYFREKNVMG